MGPVSLILARNKKGVTKMRANDWGSLYKMQIKDSSHELRVYEMFDLIIQQKKKFTSNLSALVSLIPLTKSKFFLGA